MVKKAGIKRDTQTLVTAGLMTAFVIVFQLLATYTAFFGPFSTAIALVPISIGAILCGPAVGAWLGFVFALVVLFTGGAQLFWMFNIPGTIITVVAKGMCCGYVAGLVYKLLKRLNRHIASIASAAICPVVNTGVFLLGSAVFFLDKAASIAKAAGMPDKSGMSLFIAFAVANFIFELGMSTVLSPVIVRILNIKAK